MTVNSALTGALTFFAALSLVKGGAGCRTAGGMSLIFCVRLNCNLQIIPSISGCFLAFTRQALQSEPASSRPVR